MNDEIISSTLIRNYLLEKNITKANQLLGYPYFFDGFIVRGNQIGRTIGFPTANMSREAEGYLPLDGVYAGWLVADGVLAIGFLILAIRYSSLWIGAAIGVALIVGAIYLRRWRESFMAQLGTVRTLKFDERFIRLWAFYLAYCEAAFDEANIDVVQFTLAKPG